MTESIFSEKTNRKAQISRESYETRTGYGSDTSVGTLSLYERSVTFRSAKISRYVHEELSMEPMLLRKNQVRFFTTIKLSYILMLRARIALFV
jgi:hypothetical protein